MAIIKIKRFQEGGNAPTLGIVEVFNPEPVKVLELVSVELPWRNNRRSISRIPAGRYPVVKEWSPRFREMLWELKDVPKRSEVKFHVANFMYQLNGCIALGETLADLDKDGKIDVKSSRIALDKFHAALADHRHGVVEIEDPWKR